MNTRTIATTTVACAVLVFSTLLACRKKPPPLSFTPKPRTGVGRYYALTVESAKQCEMKEAHLQPQKGFILLGVEMTFEATTDETVAIHSHEFSMTDGIGRVFKTSLAECPPAIEQQTYIKKPQRLRGVLTFEVPEGSFALTLVDDNVVSPSKGLDRVSIELNR